MMDEEEARERAEQFGIDADEFLALVTSLDALIAAMPQLMRALYAQYEAALDVGFNDEQAFALVLKRAETWIQ